MPGHGEILQKIAKSKEERARTEERLTAELTKKSRRRRKERRYQKYAQPVMRLVVLIDLSEVLASSAVKGLHS
jgi:hypothetical protein